MTHKNLGLSILLFICILNIYQSYQVKTQLNKLVNPAHKPSTAIYCTWDRGNYTLAVDSTNQKAIKETVAILGKSIEGCN